MIFYSNWSSSVIIISEWISSFYDIGVGRDNETLLQIIRVDWLFGPAVETVMLHTEHYIVEDSDECQDQLHYV